jgi:DNA repair protein RadC
MKYLRKLKIQLIKGEYKNPVKGQVRGPKQVYDVFKAIKDKNQEILIGVYLSNDLEVNAYDTLSIGGQSATLVLSDEVFDRAIITRSRYIILIHNHPSGNPAPSRQDREVMKVLSNDARVLRRVLLDFIIVGDRKYWSMFEEYEGGEYTLGGAH